MSWGIELWDQFDNLEKHTQWGIDILEKYIKFVKERTEIELSYAKQLRNLAKKYQPKKNSKEEEEYRYTACKAFLSTLNEMNDYAGQHEVISENMTSHITVELARYVQELKQERKSYFHDGRKAQQHIEICWKQLESSKRRFERDCKEADRAQQYFEKMDADINVTKADVEKDSQLVIEAYKSGFEPPGDIEFEDYTQPMKRTVSDNSLSNSRGEGKPELKFGGKSKGKLWPFIKKNKLSLKLGAAPEDFSNLPPEQRRKKLQQKVDELNKEIQKEMDQRDAITKMKDVYLKNPQMGDPASLDHKLTEVSQNIDKLRLEAQKFEAWLAEVEGRLPARSDQARRQSGMYEAQNPTTVNNCAQDRESSPDGSYTEEQSQESEVKVLATDFDDEFDDEEPLPAIGTCKALYTFEGQNEGTISVVEGETLYVIEEDKGDGWTRIRRNEEEGYVPTSYVEVYLDKNAKGAKTYI
uniref:formin-binding protein 1 isoform X8 n=1 Tax=Panthera onca TaxID=9690 RepID=UPI002955C8F6|nr:formin-binding protein 1 isoform X8 [Panthera onca]